jgi:hypothetical protein
MHLLIHSGNALARNLGCLNRGGQVRSAEVILNIIRIILLDADPGTLLFRLVTLKHLVESGVPPTKILETDGGVGRIIQGLILRDNRLLHGVNNNLSKDRSLVTITPSMLGHRLRKAICTIH